MYEGDYPAARQKFDKALRMRQAIGDRAGEAATWHNLATIDLNEGDYPAARQEVDKVLQMRQAIGDRAGEAATWHQFAMIDMKRETTPPRGRRSTKPFGCGKPSATARGRPLHGTTSPRST